MTSPVWRMTLAAALALSAACAAAPDATTPASGDLPSTTAPPPQVSTLLAPPSSTSTTAVTNSTADAVAEGPGPLGVDIDLPADPRGAVAVVLVHGGGWLGGSPASLGDLAAALADAGAIAFNASYRTGGAGGGYPATFDDVACAVRFSRQRARELGGASDMLLVGHSAGAHIASVVALAEPELGEACPWEGSSRPDRLVGLAGVYHLDFVAPIMERFLGGTREEAAETWAAVDPLLLSGNASEVTFTLVHGGEDRIAPADTSEVFAEILEEAGIANELILVPGVGHLDVTAPAVALDQILP